MEYEMEELIPIVATLVQNYTGQESTSVTYEKAQEFMKAVLYCLKEYEQANPGQSMQVMDQTKSTRDKYDIGLRLVIQKAEKVRASFNSLSAHFEDYGVECLSDTVQKGIPAFLKWYDAKYFPHNTILTLDYPLLVDLNSVTGVDAIDQYLSCIQIEQKLLGQFDKNYIISILRGYHPAYRSMFENICSIILPNIIGHMLLKKPMSDIGFRKEEYQYAAAFLGDRTVEEIENLGKDMITQLSARFDPCGLELKEYLLCDVRNMAVRIKHGIQQEHLEKLWIG